MPDFSTPGQLIQSLLNERGWTQQVLAIVLGVEQPLISKVISGRRAVDASMAIMLGEVFKKPPEIFLDLQKRFDLALAQITLPPDPGRATRAALYGELPVAEMAKRGWINIPSIKDQEATERALASFFEVSTVEEIEILPHASKKTNVFSPVSAAQMAWSYRVKQIAKDMLAARYSPERARAAVQRLLPLRASVDEARKVPKILAESGIRFVLVETLGSAKIDGVCFWLNDFSPVIGMTMRHDRIDNFWFVLRHECEHVIQRHGRSAVMIDSDLDAAANQAEVANEERVANAAAAAFCVPPDQLKKFIARKSPFFAERDLLGFARTIGVHPGLVAGQVRRATGRYDILHSHLVKVRSVVKPNAMADGWGDVAPVG